MFNQPKKQGQDKPIPKPINRLNGLKEPSKPEGEAPQGNKAGAAFSKALNAVRQESNQKHEQGKSGKGIGLGEMANSRKEKTANPFLKVSPQFKNEPAPESEGEATV